MRRFPIWLKIRARCFGGLTKFMWAASVAFKSVHWAADVLQSRISEVLTGVVGGAQPPQLLSVLFGGLFPRLVARPFGEQIWRWGDLFPKWVVKALGEQLWVLILFGFVTPIGYLSVRGNKSSCRCCRDVGVLRRVYPNVVGRVPG